MTGWARFERRWRDALLAAIIPRSADGALPGLGDIDITPFWVALEREAPLLVRLGLRLAVWGLTFAPVVLLRTPRLFPGLGAERQDELLCKAGRSRSFILRQLVTSLKAMSCLAYLRDPEVRALVAARSEAE